MSDGKDTNDLIDKLCCELKPVKCMPHPLVRMLPLIAVSLLYMLGVAWLLGMRDVMLMFDDIGLVFELLLAVSIFISAAIVLGFLAIPDMRGQGWLKAVPLTLVGVFLGWAVLNVVYDGMGTIHFHFVHCIMDGFLLLMLPTFVLSLFARCGAVTQPGWSAAMTILSFSALGWIGERLTCSNDEFFHAFVVHFLPFIMAGTAFGLLARRIFRW